MSISNAPESPHLWTVVLAAGGVNVAHELHGRRAPIQYLPIEGNRSLLQSTLSRVAEWSKLDHTIAVVSGPHESMARRQLHEIGAVETVAQPRNRGTGPSVLLAIAHVIEHEPRAIVAVVPSDHHLRDEQPMTDAVRHAEAMARKNDCIVLVGAVPEGPEEEYGWIIAESDRVKRFIEKPSGAVADELHRLGALWNTFVMVGPAHRFWELGRRLLPTQSTLLYAYRRSIGTPTEKRLLDELFSEIRFADFSRDVLEKADSLRVARLPPCGWSDWGTPRRLLAGLEGTAAHEHVLGLLQHEMAVGNAAITDAAS